MIKFMCFSFYVTGLQSKRTRWKRRVTQGPHGLKRLGIRKVKGLLQEPDLDRGLGPEMLPIHDPRILGPRNRGNRDVPRLGMERWERVILIWRQRSNTGAEL